MKRTATQTYQHMIKHLEETVTTFQHLTDFVIGSTNKRAAPHLEWYMRKVQDFIDDIYLENEADIRLFLSIHTGLIDSVQKAKGGVSMSIKEVEDFAQFKKQIDKDVKP